MTCAFIKELDAVEWFVIADAVFAFVVITLELYFQTRRKP